MSALLMYSTKYPLALFERWTQLCQSILHQIFNEEKKYYGAFMNVNSIDREMHIERFQAVAIDWQKL